MKNALVRATCNAPDSGGWKRTPCFCIHGRQLDDARIVRRARCSLVCPPVTFSRSCQYSSSGYASTSTSCGASCMQRRLRVCCELPPRHACGADSSISTDAPASRAISAAHSAAFPPPMTSTSTIHASLGRHCMARRRTPPSARRQRVFRFREEAEASPRRRAPGQRPSRTSCRATSASTTRAASPAGDSSSSDTLVIRFGRAA